MLGLATLYQLWWLLFIFPRAFRSEGVVLAVTKTFPASVVICFRNEAERLAKYLPLVLEQEHSQFEVVAVDDFSTDDSAKVVADLAKHYKNLRLVRPASPTRAGKKDALTYGISQAKFSILLLTDADCAPLSKHWISNMIAPFQDKAIELVIGYSPYRKTASFLNFFQRFETTYTAFQYLGLARYGQPYMAVGRNVAYRKSFFNRAGGLESHAHLAGGDDDLLVSHHAQAAATAVVSQTAARSISDPSTSWMDYWQRKMRHLGVGVAYPPQSKILIGLLALSHLLWYGLAIFCLVSGIAPADTLCLIVLRLLFVVWNYAFNNDEEARKPSPQQFMIRLPGILLGDFLLCFYYIFTAPALLLSSTKGGWD